MPKTLVTTIGDQAAPSLLFLCDEHFRDADFYVFITTERMEARRRLPHLLEALSIPEPKYLKVVVSPNDPEQIGRQLAALNIWEGPAEFLVNLSGGSKIMAIGVFHFFARSPLAARSCIYYLSIYDTHFLEIFPEAGRQVPLRNEIALETYLTSYGIGVLEAKREKDQSRPPAYTAVLVQRFLEEEQGGGPAPSFYRFREAIRKYFRGAPGPMDLSDDPPLRDFLASIQFELLEAGRLHPAEGHYLSGGWWEEWVHYRIKQHLALPDHAIAGPVRIEMTDEDGRRIENEFDLMFLHRHALYVVECKTGLGRRHAHIRERLDEELHRLAALRRIFGMNVRTSLLTLSAALRRKPGSPAIRSIFNSRAELLQIKLLDRYDYLSGEWLRFF